jgi:hypothetical protein
MTLINRLSDKQKTALQHKKKQKQTDRQAKDSVESFFQPALYQVKKKSHNNDKNYY